MDPALGGAVRAREEARRYRPRDAGRTPLSEEQRAALAAVVESGPDPSIHGVVRWRRCDLAAWLRDRFGVSLGVTTVGLELRRMGYAKLSARPRHDARDEAALAGLKKELTQKG